MRTFVASAKSADSRWHVIDAKDQVLGRVATLAARLLQGKHKPTYTPFIDTGDHVVVVNAEAVKLTGQKETDKLRSEEHTSELQSPCNIVCRLLHEKYKQEE